MLPVLRFFLSFRCYSAAGYFLKSNRIIWAASVSLREHEGLASYGMEWCTLRCFFLTITASCSAIVKNGIPGFMAFEKGL